MVKQVCVQPEGVKGESRDSATQTWVQSCYWVSLQSPFNFSFLPCKTVLWRWGGGSLQCSLTVFSAWPGV